MPDTPARPLIRIGLGYDIHRLVPKKRLVLGGVEIPWSAGLEGHSDADVIVHALMDALLGAARLRDIGHHFPPTDERYRDASSIALLDVVRDWIAEAGYRLMNADIVLVAEQPHVAPYIDEMCDCIARSLLVDKRTISVKATTNERVGPEGRGEAMSAQAVVLLYQVS